MLSKRAVLGMLTLSALLTAPCQGAENTVQKDIIWSQSDGLRQEIYSSSYQAGAWTEPVKITEDNANNLHPTLAVAPDGSRWAFWSAVNPDGISIEYAIGKNGKWSEPIKLELENLNSAITPSVLIDKSGIVWLVWAGNDGGQDEIYCRRYTESAWQKPELVNKANTVPDIKPKIVLNEQGVIEVRWEGVRNGKYVPLLSSYTGGHWSPEQQVEQKQAEETKPELPAFIPKDSQYSLQVP